MSTHFVPGIGHRTYGKNDVIPAEAIPRPTVDTKLQFISNTEEGYIITDIPAAVLHETQDEKEFTEGKILTTEERVSRLERLVAKLLNI